MYISEAGQRMRDSAQSDGDIERTPRLGTVAKGKDKKKDMRLWLLHLGNEEHNCRAKALAGLLKKVLRDPGKC